MKFYKKKWFWVVVVIAALAVFGIISSMIAAQNAKKTQYTTEAVQRGDLTQTVSATGAVQSAHEIAMNFKNIGKIIQLGVKEGDNVKSGQVLARIDDAAAQSSVSQARASLAAAQADLARIKAGASNEDIALSQQQLAKAQSDLTNLQSDSELQLANLKDKNIDALSSSAVTVQVALDKVYNYLLDDDFDLYFLDANLNNKVNNSYQPLLSRLQSTRSKIAAASDTGSINAVSGEMKSLMADTNSFLNDCFNLANAIVVNSTYTQTAKDNIKSDLNSQISTVNTSLSALQVADSNLTNSGSAFASQLAAAKNNVAIAQAQLSLKQAGPRNFEIQAAQARVAQAQAVLSGAMSTIRDYQIVAPIDGKVVAVNYSVGEQPSGAEPVIKMLSNEKFEIDVDIPESDIVKVKVGDKVAIDLDAFGAEKVFDGTVTFVDPAQTVVQGVIYYKTTVVFDDGEMQDRIKPGMTANVTISTASRQGVLYVPQRAVKIKETTFDQQISKYVEVLVADQQTEEREVVTGLKADGGLVEILSGLDEGEQAVTFKKTGNQ